MRFVSRREQKARPSLSQTDFACYDYLLSPPGANVFDSAPNRGLFQAFNVEPPTRKISLLFFILAVPPNTIRERRPVPSSMHCPFPWGNA